MPFYNPANDRQTNAERAGESFRLIRQSAKLLFWLRDNHVPLDDYWAWCEGGSQIDNYLKETDA